MARDIEEFLKQAAQRRQEKLRQRQQQQPVQPNQPPPVQPPRPAQPQPPQITQRPQKPQQRRVSPPLQQRQPDIQIIEARDASRPLSQPLQERHVETLINTRRLGEHAEQLGDRIEQADDIVNARVQKKFDHDLGHISVGEKIADDTTFVDKTGGISPVAVNLLKALRDPKSIQQAILLTEVLKRPEFD